MGSFNFKAAPHYQEKSAQFIGKNSETILPLSEVRGEARKDITLLPLGDKLTKYDGQLPFPLSCIGLLRVRHPHNNKIIDGTCTLIAPRILLTCAHNLYSYEEKIYYKELDFFPKRNGREEKRIHITVKPQNVKIHPYFHEYQTSEHEHYDYGIIFLEESIDDLCGCVEVSANYTPKEGENVYLFGYPIDQNNIKNQANLYGAKGKVVKFTTQTLFYEMETGAGQSGGPLLVETDGHWRLIGIHTLSDPSGVLITPSVAAVLNSWINLSPATLTIHDGQIFLEKALKLSKMVEKYDWVNLIGLTLNKCNITTQNLTYLNKLSWNLLIVILDENKIDRIALQPSQFKQLQKLFLNHNSISKVQDSVNRFNRLSLLSLKNNRITSLDTKITSKGLKIILCTTSIIQPEINVKLEAIPIDNTWNFDSNYVYLLMIIKNIRSSITLSLTDQLDEAKQLK